MKTKLSRYRVAIALFVPILMILVTTVSCSKKVAAMPEHKKSSTDPELPPVAYSYAVGGNNDLATLGRVLFYDKNLSGDRTVSCGSCHQQQFGFADNKKLSTGAYGVLASRNTHIITQSDNSRFWDGKNQVVFNNIVTSCSTSTVTTTVLTSNYSVTTSSTVTTTSTTCLEELIQAAVFTNPVKIPFITTGEMNIGLQELRQRISSIPYYSELFSKAFPGNSTPVTETNIELALGVFMDNFVSGNSKFDMVNNGSAQFTPEEADGFNVFNGKGKCSLCHKPDNNFAGKPGQFEDIGLDAFYGDQGRKRLTNLVSDEGRFHVPTLKNISLTAPYMHDGRFRTLNEVVDFFDNGVQQSVNLSTAMSAHPTPDGNGGFIGGATNIQPLSLTSTEKANLVEFLKTLTDYAIINDKKLSDPFKH